MTACPTDVQHRIDRLSSNTGVEMLPEYYDVEFLVGPPDGETWRLTGRSDVLAYTNPVMKALLKGPLASRQGTKSSPITITDVEPRAFHHLLRYLENGELPRLQTVDTALATIYAAHKYMCPRLEWESAAYLNQHMKNDPKDVIDIIRFISVYSDQFEGRNNLEPTAPPAEDVESDYEGTGLMRQCSNSSQTPIISVAPRRGSFDGFLGEACCRLKHNCLQVVDQHADQVLELEQIEDLDQQSLLELTSRNTLAVSSELRVLSAVERWAECASKRLKYPHDTHHLREVIGGSDVVCSGELARLLLLTPQQFAEGPARSALLTPEEQRSLLVYLASSNKNVVPNGPKHIMWSKLATSRTPKPPEFLPIPSLRKASKNSRYADNIESKHPEENKRRRWGLRWPSGKRKSKKASPTRQVKEKLPEQPSCCSRTCDVLITVIACLFD